MSSMYLKCAMLYVMCNVICYVYNAQHLLHCAKIGNMRKNVIHENLLLLEQTATMEAFECVFFNKCAISVVSIPIRC